MIQRWCLEQLATSLDDLENAQSVERGRRCSEHAMSGLPNTYLQWSAPHGRPGESEPAQPHCERGGAGVVTLRAS